MQDAWHESLQGFADPDNKPGMFQAATLAGAETEMVWRRRGRDK
jgi:hypothetical protein